MATRTPKPSRSSAGSSTDGPPAKKRKTGDQDDAKNHGNKPSPSHSGGATNPNTPVFPYLSKAQKRGSCDKEQDAIKKNCDEKTGKQKSAQAPDKLSNTKSLGAFAEKVKGAVVKLDDGAKKLYGYNAETQNNANQWVGEHCSGLWVKPGGGLDPTNISRFKDQLEAIKQDYLNDASGLAQKMGWSIVQKVEDRAAAYGQQVLEEEGAAAVSLLVPGVGEVVEAGTQVWVALTGVWNAVSTAYSVAKFAVTEGPKIIAQIKDLIAQADSIKKLLNSDTSMFDVMADMMAGIAELNPCVKARKCSLVMLLALAEQMSPNSLPSKVDADPWLVAFNRAEGSLDEGDANFLYSFLLTRAFGSKTRHAAELICCSFDHVYSASRSNLLGNSAWSMINEVLPRRYYFSINREPPVSLVIGVANLFVDRELSGDIFLNCTANDQLFSQLANQVERSSGGRRYIKKVLSTISRDDGSASLSRIAFLEDLLHVHYRY